jgi:GNAT superfamily N-acetyltransferase
VSDLLESAVRNCAATYGAMSQAMGRPAVRTDDVSLADLGLLVAQAPNNATVLRPFDGPDDPALDAIDRFFAARPGGGFETWSAWPTPDLSERWTGPWAVPGMVREPGGSARPAPRELDVVEAADAAAMRDAEGLWIECFECVGSPPGAVADERLLERARVWVGYVDSRPVASSLAYASDGVVGVFCVATTADARGRGYGEALTWAATMSDPSRPAVLQASEMGAGVYRRMGFREAHRFTVWEGERAAATSD